MSYFMRNYKLLYSKKQIIIIRNQHHISKCISMILT